MEEINILNGLILASITAAVCAAGFIAGTKKRTANDAEKASQTDAGNGE